MTTIIVTHEDNEVDEFEFESGHEIISIGRRSDNDVSIPNLSISGSHAKICLEGDQAFLEDLNSTNGTYVNGEVVKRRAIYNGDDIILGKIRLAAVLPIIASAEIASESRVDASDSSSEDDFMGVSSNKMSGTPDSDDMSFDEDARLFAQSSSEPETAIEQSSDDDVQAAEFSDNPEPDNGFDDDLDNALKSSFASERFGSQDHDDDAPMIADFDTDNEPHPLDGIDSKLLGGHADDEPLSHELDSPSATSKGAVIEIKNGAKSGQILPIDKPVTTLGRPGIQIAAIMRKPDGYFLMHIESDDSVDRPTLNQDSIGDEPVLLHSGDELNVAGIDVEFMLS